MMLTPESIHVQHFSTFPSGGAAMATQRLHLPLLKYGVDSRFVYHRGDEGPDGSQRLTFDAESYAGLLGWAKYRIARYKQKRVYWLHKQHIADRTADFETYGMARLPTPTRLKLDFSDSSIVHLHWLSFFVDYPSFFSSIPDDVPLVWTLHDMNAFTGGCHFSDACHRFQLECGHCPQLRHSHAKDVSRDSFAAKKHALRNKTVHVVAPSKWLYELARESPVWPAQTKFHTIHYGLDLKTFRPIDRTLARRNLNLPQDRLLLAFGANDVANHRKGFRLLAKALQIVNAQQPVECLVFGAGDVSLIPGLPKSHTLGFIESHQTLAEVYSAADVVIVPSLEDNQPQVGLEAMACGTPVVAFDSGGIPEYVRHGRTGLTAACADYESLAKHISRLIVDANFRKALGKNARQLMEVEFEMEAQAWQYLKLYRRVLMNNHKNTQAAGNEAFKQSRAA